MQLEKSKLITYLISCFIFLLGSALIIGWHIHPFIMQQPLNKLIFLGILAAILLISLLFTILSLIHLKKQIIKEAEAKILLEKAYVKATEATKAKTIFLANMSHEIRTPMNTIMGFTELLLYKSIASNPENKNHLTSIMDCGKALLSLIDQALDLAKIESGKLNLNLLAANLNHLFKELNSIFLMEAKSKGLELHFDISPIIPETLVIDRLRLRQVLINLIGNAIKFTKSGAIHVKAKAEKLNKEKNNLDIIFSVKDSGCGIDKDYQGKIFLPFEQIIEENSISSAGTGLGLTISRELANKMNGSLQVDSEKGKGSTFNLYLNNVAIASKENDEELKEYSSLNPKKEIVSFEPAKILLVDDVEHNRSLIKAYLSSYSFTIYEATNGKEAIDLSQKIIPDIILLDMRMPIMNGYEAAKIINTNEKTQSIPIIAITASITLEKEQQTKKLCQGLLRKPLSKKKLISELCLYLKHETEKSTQDS